MPVIVVLVIEPPSMLSVPLPPLRPMHSQLTLLIAPPDMFIVALFPAPLPTQISAPVEFKVALELVIPSASEMTPAAFVAALVTVPVTFKTPSPFLMSP